MTPLGWGHPSSSRRRKGAPMVRSSTQRLSEKTAEAKIVELYLQRKTYSEIARQARHTPSAIKRYVETLGVWWCCGSGAAVRRVASNGCGWTPGS